VGIHTRAAYVDFEKHISRREREVLGSIAGKGCCLRHRFARRSEFPNHPAGSGGAVTLCALTRCAVSAVASVLASSTTTTPTDRGFGGKIQNKASSTEPPQA
jgi:hypothetical protein